MDEDVIFMADETLLTLAADIVSAHVSHNAVAADQLPVLIQSVYASLAGLGQAPAPVEEKREPAVSVRSSVKADAIACLECGAKMKMLKRHLSTDHGLSPAEYRSPLEPGRRLPHGRARLCRQAQGTGGEDRAWPQAEGGGRNRACASAQTEGNTAQETDCGD
jgi:predicted transcriptional regulator